jgi:hypothetical protein
LEPDKHEPTGENISALLRSRVAMEIALLRCGKGILKAPHCEIIIDLGQED